MRPNNTNILNFIRRFSLKTSLFLNLVLIGTLSFLSAGQAEVETYACGRTPVDVVLMLDRTGSISAENRELIRGAAQDLVDILLYENPDNRIALGRFGSMDCSTPSTLSPFNREEASLGEVFHELSGDSYSLEESLNSALEYSSCGATNYEDPLRDAGESLEKGKNQQKVLVFISDGNPNLPANQGAKPAELALKAAEELKSKGVRVFTIAFDASDPKDASLRSLLAKIASGDSQDNTVEEVDDTEKQMENQDGDDFFIAPSGDDLRPVFSDIGEVILCEVEPEVEPEVKSKEDNFRLETLPAPEVEETPPPPPSANIETTEEDFDAPLSLEGSGTMACSLSYGNTGQRAANIGLALSLLLSLSGGIFLKGRRG